MPDPGPRQKTYSFGDFVVDERRAELSGPEGRIRLRPQSFAVLQLLVANPGRLMTKNDLHARVWGDRAVTDDSITQCLIDIRKALGDTGREIVRTVPRRGYVFAAEVAVASPDPSLPAAAPERRARRRLTAVAIAGAVVCIGLAWLWQRGGLMPATAPMERSVAVLPFVDMSGRRDQQYLGNGLSEDIVSSLGRYPALRVIARTSSFSLAAQSADIEQIRESLNVAYVLEGSIRRVGDQVRIVAQLIDSTDSTKAWSDTYEISQQELFSIQNAIAESVAQAIAPGQESTVAQQQSHDGFRAGDFIWLARRYETEVRARTDVNRAMLDQAIRLYRDATQADPDSALAHSRLGNALLYGGDVDEARKSVFRALELDPDLSEVQATLGTYYFATNLPDKAAVAWKRAIELNPSNVDALGAYATWYWLHVDSAGAAKYFRQALELDPLSLSRYADFGFYLAGNSRVQETEDIIRRVGRLFSGAEANLVIGRLSYLLGRVDESIAWTIRARDLEPANEQHVAALAELYVDIGDDDTALRLMPEPSLGILIKMRRYDEFIDEAELVMIDEPDDVHLRYLLAFAYNATGRSAEAVRLFGDVGMLELTSPRQIIDIEARVTLADALAETGNMQAARENAEWWVEQEHLDGDDWWRSVYRACSLAILERDDEALDLFEQIPRSHRLPWQYLLKDSPCFRRYTANRRYQRVLAQIDARLAAMRARVPQTLAAFGVRL